MATTAAMSAGDTATTDPFSLSATAALNLTGNASTSNVTCLNDYCVSDEEYVDMIQRYIFPTLFEWILISVYILVFVAGLVGNFLVCFAVWHNQHMRTVTNFFIVNLAVADFLVILVCLPPTVLDDVTETWYMGRIMCKIVKYLQVILQCNRWNPSCEATPFTPEKRPFKRGDLSSR